jgi:diazepam-binding inhibitor (GABA receptor modulating acyl-CoA-binding protein)
LNIYIDKLLYKDFILLFDIIMAMINVNDLFLQATIDVKALPSTPDDESMLSLYAYFKQATVGDINTEKPSFFNFKDTAKWNAWEKVKGMQKIQAQGNYIKLVKDLQIKLKV